MRSVKCNNDNIIYIVERTEFNLSVQISAIMKLNVSFFHGEEIDMSMSFKSRSSFDFYSQE
jgi:hypothetical protein